MIALRPLLALSGLALAACAQGTSPASAETAVANEDIAALLTALDDEYKAEATYEAVLAKFGDARPFINIIEAERMHQSMAIDELERLGAEYPRTNPYAGKIAAPATLLEACETGIVAEEENVALYDRILPGVNDSQVRTVLERLQAASRDRHLPAFQRCVARGGTMGGGMGHGGMGHGPGGGNGPRGPGGGN